MSKFFLVQSVFIKTEVIVEREQLSKKIRFEVFKRDSFKCQYCGKSVPDVILHVDHINPVSNGGKNDLLNLITSCQDCNLGKSDRLISDQSILKKQMNQAEIISIKIEQMKLLADWYASLNDLNNQEYEFLTELLCRSYYVNITYHEVSDEMEIKKALKKYGLDKIIKAAEVSANQYLIDETEEAEIKFVKNISKIAHVQDKDEKNPDHATLRKAVNYSAKRWGYCDKKYIFSKLAPYVLGKQINESKLISLIYKASNFGNLIVMIGEHCGEEIY